MAWNWRHAVLSAHAGLLVLPAGCFSCCPINSVKALKAVQVCKWNLQSYYTVQIIGLCAVAAWFMTMSQLRHPVVTRPINNWSLFAADSSGFVCRFTIYCVMPCPLLQLPCQIFVILRVAEFCVWMIMYSECVVVVYLVAIVVVYLVAAGGTGRVQQSITDECSICVSAYLRPLWLLHLSWCGHAARGR